MDRWAKKVAVVTGASVGIGQSIAVTLAKHGMIVIAMARREDKLKKLSEVSKGNIYPLKCDIKSEKSIIEAFKYVEKHFGGVDLLVNNAGYFHNSGLEDGITDEWRNVLETNVMGLSICSKEALKTMKTRNNDGHIININSVAGHSVSPIFKSRVGMYPASKFAVTALTQSLRMELRNCGSSIKVTSVSPGLVATDMGELATKALNLNLATKDNPIGGLLAQDVADAVISIISLHPRVEIQELILQSSEIPVAGVNLY